MLKYYVSKNYRKAYDSLEQMGLLSDSYAISYQAYRNYASELIVGQSTIGQHLQILAADKCTPIKIVKSLLIVHALLQANITLESYDVFYSFMNQVLSNSQAMAVKIKGTQKSLERVRAKSAVYSGQGMKNEEIEQSKEIFLLQSIVKPYVLYLQKIVSVFTLYSLLSKTLYRSLVTAEVWILLNIFKYGNSVTINLPVIYSFKRKSFSPLAEGLAEAFSTDFNHFYPKLNKFIREDCNRIEVRFNELAHRLGEVQALKGGVQGLDDAVNVLQQIEELNRQLKLLYDPVQCKRANISSPKMVQLSDQQFQFVLYWHKMKKSGDLGTEPTPKFYRTKSNQTENTQQNKQQGKPQLVPMFRDMTNGDQFLCTFRKDKEERHLRIHPRYKREQQNCP